MIAMVFVGLGVSIFWYCLMTDWTFISDPNKAGLIGDSFGPLTSLFSSLALGAAVIATYYQVREFRSQIKEMSESKEELEKQTTAMNAQLNEMRKQTANQVLANAINYLPHFSAELMRGSDPQRNFRITNTGHCVYGFSWRSEQKMSIDSVMLNSSRQRDTIAVFGKPNENVLSVAFRPMEDELSSKGLKIIMSYTLFSGHKIEECFTVYFSKPYASPRSEQVQHIRAIILQEYLVEGENKQPPALTS